MPIGGSAAWLKAVPPFFAHESRMLAVLDSAVVPTLIAADGPLMLLEDIPGVDQRHAVGASTLVMVRLLVGLQVEWAARSDELLAGLAGGSARRGGRRRRRLAHTHGRLVPMRVDGLILTGRLIVSGGV